MYPIPPTEKLIETKICRHCGVSFPITDKDLEFYEKVSPVFQTPPILPLSGERQIFPPDKGDKGGFRYTIPSPTLCPDCRQQRRLSFRNERKLYKRKCDLTGKDIISIFSPDKPFKVYEQSEWWSDKWDPMDYGRDFDFSRPFFEQFGELMREVPKIALYIDKTMASSAYCNYGLGCHECYLCVNCYVIANSFYSTSCWPNDGISTAYDIVDCDNCADSSFIYQCLDLERCHKCFYSRLLEDCSDCYFSEGLQSCSYCIGCVNLRQKTYHILNQKVTQDVFEETVALLLGSSHARKEFKKQFESLRMSEPYRSTYISNSENSTGDFISDSKNLHSSFLVISTENGKYSYTSGYLTKNMYDGMNAGGESDMLYEAQHAHYEHHSAFILDVDHCQDVYLSVLCYSCKFCFWCIGLRNKQYCIFNKQYTREQYEELVPKIIEHMRKTGEWGEFFPSSISPFGYNETVASEYFPLSRTDVLAKHLSKDNWKPIFNWSDYENPRPDVSKVIPASKLPDDITKIPDDILNWAIECEVTGKPFRIIKQELEFYRKYNLPIPRRHPDQRHLDRMSLRNPRKLFERKCDKCHTPMTTTYSPERPEKVYCEGCYNKEIL